MDTLFGVLDWIAAKAGFQWPGWLLEWAWSRQATLYTAVIPNRQGTP